MQSTPHLPALAPLSQGRAWPTRDAWGRPPGFWRRLLGRGAQRRQVGILRADAEEIAIEYLDAGTQARLRWDQPALCKVSCWPVEAGCEVNLSLRTRGAGAAEPWIQFRAMWPLEAVAESCPRKQELFPFVEPSALSLLWPILTELAALHGASPPTGLSMEVRPGALEGLWSPSRAPLCVACGAASVVFVAPQVYRCHACGYEGGEGLAALMRLRRQAKFDALTFAEKAALAARKAREARRLLLGCQGDVDFIYYSNQDREAEEVMHRRLTRVTQWILEALDEARDVAYLKPQLQGDAERVEALLSWVHEPLSKVRGHSYEQELIEAHALMERAVVVLATQAPGGWGISPVLPLLRELQGELDFQVEGDPEEVLLRVRRLQGQVRLIQARLDGLHLGAASSQPLLEVRRLLAWHGEPAQNLLGRNLEQEVHVALLTLEGLLQR